VFLIAFWIVLGAGIFGFMEPWGSFFGTGKRARGTVRMVVEASKKAILPALS
jgi:hypothetical protein